jgi:hypothetical protein
MRDPVPEKPVEATLAQPLLRGRRVVTTGLAFARTHKTWRTPAVAAVLIAGGALALAVAVIGIAGG